MAANVGANSSNYITPLHITQLSGKPSSLKIDIKTKGNDLIINNISLDTQTAHFADIKGTVASYAGKNPVFKNLKINTPNNFSFSIPDMPNSSVTLNSDLTIGGSMNYPKILGNINISKFSIPSFKLKGGNLSVNMTNSAIKASRFCLVSGLILSKWRGLILLPFRTTRVCVAASNSPLASALRVSVHAIIPSFLGTTGADAGASPDVVIT